MSPINQEPINDVLVNYDFEVFDIRNENYKEKKGVWWLKTSIGDKILKKVSCSEQTLKFLLSAVEHLTNNGVLLPKVNKSRNSSNYVVIDDVCFTVTDAIIGYNPSYDVPEELEMVVKALADFHKASIGFSVPEDSKPKDHLGDWVEDYTRVLEEMNELYKEEVQAGGKNSVGQLIIEEFPYFYEKAQGVIDNLKGQAYKNWVDKIKETGGLCHQDFAAGNLILSSSGLYVIDTDSITFELPARDIRKLFNKIMKKAVTANAELARRIVELYQASNPLTSEEWQVVKYDLIYPHLFLGAMSKYYYQKEPEWTYEKYLKRIREMVEVEKAMAPIYEKFDSLTENIAK